MATKIIRNWKKSIKATLGIFCMEMLARSCGWMFLDVHHGFSYFMYPNQPKRTSHRYFTTRGKVENK